MAKKEITVEQLQTDCDWQAVFGLDSGGNTTREVTGIPSDTASLAEVCQANVVEIIAAVNGDNDGPYWVGLFLLRDGRYLVASGGCDYTGWDCQASNNLVVASTLELAMRLGLSESERARLEL